MKPSLPLLGALAALTVSLSAATTNWTDGAHDSAWTSAGNWSAGVPTATSTVNINTQPTDNIIGVNTGLINNSVAGINFSNSLTSPVLITNAGVEQLNIGSGISNASAFAHQFGLELQITSAAALATGGGLQFLGGLELANQATVSGTGTLLLGSGASTILDLGTTTYGRLAGSGNLSFTGNHFVFDLLHTATAGSSWDLFDGTVSGSGLESVSLAGAYYNGDLAQTSTGTWVGTVNGLKWQFTEADGRLLVVPEPGSGTLLLLAAAGALGHVRGRRRARRC